MTDIPTARGSVSSDALGHTLMHEHIFICSLDIESEYPELVGWDEEAEVARAIAMLNRASAIGIDTIVDMTILGQGRSVARIQRVAREVKVNIVVATGMYVLNDLPMLFRFVGPGAWVDRPELMTEMFVKDVTQGIGATGIRAGVIKAATDVAGVTPGVERVLRSVAQAHRATGAPIATHADALNRRGLEQQAIFAAEGVDLTRVLIGHAGDTREIDYLKRLADAGSYLGMDRFGVDGGRLPSFDERADMVAAMVEAGYVDHMVLSHDTGSWLGWLPRRLTAGSAADFSWLDYTHIHTRVVPALLQRGVSEEQVRRMLVDNPARFFGRTRAAY